MYEIFIPKSAILRKHIYNFCILNEFDGATNYLAFPQLGTTIGLYVNANVEIGENRITISKASVRHPQIIVLRKYKLPLQMKYEQSVAEVAINFTPAGLNYFFKENTNAIANKEAQLLISQDWDNITNKIFNASENNDKIEILERFLIESFIAKDLSIIESYILILIANPEFALLNIANKLNISTKTANRYFANYIGCSPMDFKKILRFRKAIHAKFNDPLKNLTEICYDSNFYDSPHFTREFKKLTRMNPREFFAGIKTEAEKDFPYKFL